MLKDLKIGTWNLCLGLQNKRDLVVSTLTERDVSICCLQECEIPVNFPERFLNSGKYTLELELNDEEKSSKMESLIQEDMTLKHPICIL